MIESLDEYLSDKKICEPIFLPLHITALLQRRLEDEEARIIMVPKASEDTEEQLLQQIQAQRERTVDIFQRKSWKRYSFGTLSWDSNTANALGADLGEYT
ncbi:hypothetical protein D9758_013550 [Tetrapyrgos nigripes]|uniref:Uncharacterized protein n=1 Tax=Tetrapyrgos nigripes TaxID=182062 RepID=A0A8H5CEV0_9AGAR|nr:hypothetical protein D9758_013550 [Tetrapyrgos nigripes]